MKRLGLGIATLAIAFGTNARAQRSKVSIIHEPGQIVENGVLVVYPGQRFKLKFEAGYAKEDLQKRRLLFASAATYPIRVPFEKIGTKTLLTRFMYCAGETGVSDPADASLWLEDPAQVNSAHFAKTPSKGSHVWLQLTDKSEVVVRLDSNDRFKGDKDVYLAFASQEHSPTLEFYIRPGHEEDEEMWMGAHAITQEKLTTVAAGPDDRIYQTCVLPTAGLHIKIRQPVRKIAKGSL